MPAIVLRVERAEPLLELERAGERGRHGHLLVEREADQQRERVLRDERVGLVVAREVEAVGHRSYHPRAMRVGFLGAGPVGQTLAAKLRELGHDVSIGTRTPREGAVSYAEAAAGAELVINATTATSSLEALDAAGAENLAGKVLIDVSNALDFSQGHAAARRRRNDDSIGEQIQRAHPDTRVVKALNTVNNCR